MALNNSCAKMIAYIVVLCVLNTIKRFLLLSKRRVPAVSQNSNAFVGQISTQNGVGKGSARSIPGCHLYEALCECADELEAFGGHSMAAGLRIDAATIGQFRQRFESIIREKTQSTDLNPKLAIDYDLQFHDISDKLLDELESLQPFGEKNPDPLFQT